MPGVPSRLLKKGKFARLPFITGTNLDEGEATQVGLSFLIELCCRNCIYTSNPAY